MGCPAAPRCARRVVYGTPLVMPPCDGILPPVPDESLRLQ